MTIQIEEFKPLRKNGLIGFARVRMPSGDLKNTETLEQVADRVCDLLTTADRSMKQAQAQRLEAAMMLLAVRPRVEAEHPRGWNAWCRGNIRRSRSDIANLLTLARTFTPKAALEAQNAKRRAVAAERTAERLKQKDVQPLDMTVAEEEKAAAEAASQRQQQALAEKFQADKEARAAQQEIEIQRGRAEQEAAAVTETEAPDAAAIEVNLDFSGHLRWSRVPFVMEKIGSVLSVPEMHALRTLVVGTVRHRRLFADAISNWITGSAACADGPAPAVADPEPEPEADEAGVDYDDLTGPGIDKRNVARRAVNLGDGA